MNKPETKTMWDKCQEVADTPEVDDALRDFLEDPHNDSGVELVRKAVEVYLEKDQEAKMKTLQYISEQINESVSSLVNNVLDNPDDIWEQSQPKKLEYFSLFGLRIYTGTPGFGWNMYGFGWGDDWFLGFSIKE